MQKWILLCPSFSNFASNVLYGAESFTAVGLDASKALMLAACFEIKMVRELLPQVRESLEETTNLPSYQE